MLLRDERQMAVNAVETLCFETADSYANAATKTDDASLTELFGKLATQRAQLAAELAAHIRAMDDLPQQPDPDREALEHVVSGIKAFLSGNARAALVEERMRGEDGLIASARDALRQELPPETRSMLERILAHGESAKRELTDALA